MRASEVSYCFFYVSVSSLLLAAGGCSGSQSDRTVRVSQAPAPASGPAEAVPARLAGGSAENSSGSGTPAATTLSATASIDDSSDVVRQVNRTEPLGMIGSDEGVDEQQLLEAFEHADPQVREMAEQQYRATVARAQSLQSQQPFADPAAAGNTAASQEGMISSTDGDNDRGVPTLPGSDQRVAEAQPKPETHPANASTGAGAMAPATASKEKSAEEANPDADEAELSKQASQTELPATGTALVSREAELTKSFDRVDKGSESGQKANEEETTAAKPSATDEQEAASFEEQFAMLDEKRLFEALITRYAAGEENESEAAGLRRRINHRLLLTMVGRVDEAVEPFEGLASSEQEYLRHQILALWTAIDPQGHPVSQRRWTTALPHLREATSYLAAATGKLDVRSLTFCTEVVSFGRVVPFEVNRFAPGQEVILYSEIDCFAAERLSDGYETHFNGSFEIFDASGKRVVDKVLPSDRQSGKNYRRDYFLAYRMHLPSHLDPGSYRLELTIEDIKGKKYGSSSIAFDIEGSAGP